MTLGCSYNYVCVEKNPTLSIWEGQKLIEAVGQHKQVLQIGFQNRSAPYGFSDRDYIKSGKLGNIVHVKCYNMLGGSKWMPEPDTATLKGLNWDAWQGPAKAVPYNPGRHSMTGRGGWLDFWSYGGGVLSDDASHVMDLARLAMCDPGQPKSVYCTGGNVGFHSIKETPELGQGREFVFQQMQKKQSFRSLKRSLQFLPSTRLSYCWRF